MNEQQRAVVQQALELAESWQKTCLDCGRSSDELGRATNQLAALRQLLEQPEQEPLGFWQGEFKDGSASLYEVPQESLFGRKYPNIPVYTTPPAAQPAPVQEPVAEVAGSARDLHIKFLPAGRSLQLGDKLYPPPAQPAAFVGLTDEDVMAEAAKEEQAHGFIQGVRWADAKLREKNAPTQGETK